MIDREYYTINGRAVNLKSLEIDGVETDDYPDFCDAYLTYGQFNDGTELSEDELYQFNDEYEEVVNEMAHESLI